MFENDRFVLDVVGWNEIGPTPDSNYVRDIWLPILGPTAVMALQRLSWLAILHRIPREFTRSEVALTLGVGPERMRIAMMRIVRYRLAHRCEGDELALLAHCPIVPLRMLHRVPDVLYDSRVFVEWHGPAKEVRQTLHELQGEKNEKPGTHSRRSPNTSHGGH